MQQAALTAPVCIITVASASGGRYDGFTNFARASHTTPGGLGLWCEGLGFKVWGLGLIVLCCEFIGKNDLMVPILF
jgi:hypothetical protein